jgi:hypothetical protein
MKKVFLMLAVAGLFIFTACGQSAKNVPNQVKSSFAKKFPDATKVKWDQEDENVWEAEFKLANQDYSANYDNNGVWKETEYAIKVVELPSAIKDKLNADFADYKVKIAEISETPEAKVYELIIKNKESKMEVVFDTYGKLIKKEKFGEEDEEDND